MSDADRVRHHLQTDRRVAPADVEQTAAERERRYRRRVVALLAVSLVLVRALRRGDPIVPEHRDLALRTARDIAGKAALVWVYVAIAALQLANVPLQDRWGRWTSLACGVAFLGVAGSFGWQVQRMRRVAQRLEASTR